MPSGMERMLGSLAGSMAGHDGAPVLLAGTGRDQVHLVVVMTSDRGLCGGFNSTIVRAARRKIRELREQGKEVKIFCVGRKGREQLRRDLGGLIVGHIEDIGNRGSPSPPPPGSANAWLRYMPPASSTSATSSTTSSNRR